MRAFLDQDKLLPSREQGLWVVGAEQLAGEGGGTELVDCLLSQEGLIAAFLLSTGTWILQGGLGGGGMRCAGVCCSRLFVLHPP